jgi:hypothetical protein
MDPKQKNAGAPEDKKPQEDTPKRPYSPERAVLNVVAALGPGRGLQ